VLGSRSTYLPAAFGGHSGRALRTGDRLTLGSRSGPLEQGTRARSLAQPLMPQYDRALRIIAGEHLGSLTEGARTSFWSTEFVVSSRSDRMGYRLDGQTLELVAATEVLSAAVTMGTIQLPAGGSPILLMADRQTTGGYPRLGQVASVDLGSAAQLKPGDTIRFAQVSLEDAQRMYLERQRATDALRRALAHSP
jgi:antagonist of KipI